MSETLKYGIRHRPPDNEETHRLRWAFAFLAVVATASFIYARGCKAQPAVPDGRPAPAQPEPATPSATPPAPDTAPATQPKAPRPDAKTVLPQNPPPAKPTAKSPAAKRAERWLASSATCPQTERTLLERLAEAERQGRTALAIDTLEKLRARPAMAYLDDQLARRLGELNVQMLLSETRTPWTAVVEVKRGDSLQRLAREHGTTLAAALRLNNLKDSNHLSIGQKIRLLEFPKAALVVHKQTKIADLTLNGKFFKRYYVSTSAATKPGPYPITREKGPLDRFAELSIRAAEDDRDELKMFLAPGSALAIADP